jgi:mono/diheme cytochrome c family protein
MARSLGICFLFLLAGCSATSPPEVTPKMARASSHGPATVGQLQHGRVLFASRCIECHTLPPIARYTDSQWPHLVNAMAGRASLKPEEREAVLSYILAARAKDSNPASK